MSTWLPQLEEHTTFDLRVVIHDSSPMLGGEITFSKRERDGCRPFWANGWGSVSHAYPEGQLTHLGSSPDSCAFEVTVVLSEPLSR